MNLKKAMFHKTLIEGETKERLTNYFYTGIICIFHYITLSITYTVHSTECPVGYYGDNCSLSCPAQSYDWAEQCSCSHAACHNVYGCNMIGWFTYNYSAYVNFVCKTSTYDKYNLKRAVV